MNVNKYITVIALLLIAAVFSPVSGQRQSDKLKKQEKQLLRNINDTKNLISKTRNSEKITIAELAILNQQILHREELIQNYSSQVRNINRQIEENESVIQSLQGDMLRLKKNYIKMVRYAYRHRNSYHNLLFVFASGSFNQAYLRVKYLRQLSDYRKKQVALIKLTRTSIAQKVKKLALHRQEKEQLVTLQEGEREAYRRDKDAQQQVLSKLKTEEGKLRRDLEDQERDRERLAQQIRKAIQEEIRKEQEELARIEAEKAKKNNSGKTHTEHTNTGTKTNNTHKGVNPMTITPEVQLESDEFEANKGSLPWPVASGEITSHFGRHPHPTVSNVEVNNDGIDIGTTKNSTVRTVFKGKVSSVFVVENAGKCVIVTHGIYRTVYTNLADVFVKKGQEITTKQSIGTLLSTEGSAVSEAHFEIWKVDGTVMHKQNPSLWLYR